ncbi:transposase [Streptomyces sp. SID6041]|nr:transposase [Streptomyces sp. SID6041]
MGTAAAVPSGEQRSSWSVAGSASGDRQTLHRARAGVQRRDLPERFGPWKTVYERPRLWSADGTWERLLQQVQAAADAAGELRFPGIPFAPGPGSRPGGYRHR